MFVDSSSARNNQVGHRSCHGRPRFFLLILGFGLPLIQLAFAGRGVINDPDGFTNVRAEPSENAAIVGRVKTGETFEYEGRENAPWWKVALAPGKKGWMHSSRIRRFAALEDIVVAENDEINTWARRRGLNYYPLACAAAKGDPAAMQRYFGLGCDGAACETHDEVFVTVIHLLGDEKMARFLSQQAPTYQKEVGDFIKNSNALLPFEQIGYLKRNFPKTAKVLFPP